MSVLVKYKYDMSNERYAYCTTIIELMKMGHKYRDARNIVVTSPIIGMVHGEEGDAWYHAMSARDTAEWILNWHKLPNRRKEMYMKYVPGPDYRPKRVA